MRRNLLWWAGLSMALYAVTLWGDWPALRISRLTTVPLVAAVAITIGSSRAVQALSPKKEWAPLLTGLIGALVFSLWWRLTE